ncbi:MAG: hypothetical protein ACYCWL_09150 [Thauera sp.]
MKLRQVATLALMACASLSSGAAADGASAWQFSGFATLGAVYTNSDKLQFARVGIDEPGGYKVDPGPDSVLGVQAGLRLGERNTAVVQLMTRETQRGDYDPRATLAFLSHALTPELTVRAGRLRSPFFMLSDAADINYNQPWVRPPTEVYGLNPFSDLDGIDLLHRSRIGDTFVEIHPYFGRGSVPVIGGGRARLEDLAGVRVTVEAGRLSLSAGHAKANLSVRRSSAGYLAFIESVGLPASLQEQLSGDGADASFSSLGLQWDDGRWLISAEVARNTASAFTNSATGAYISVGRRMGNLTPYLSLARQWQDEPLVDPAEAGAFAAVLAPFNRSRNQAQRSITTGVRWDVLHNAALKAEFTHVRTDRDAHGTFIARDDPFAPGLDRQSINLMSISVDVVF